MCKKAWIIILYYYTHSIMLLRRTTAPDDFQNVLTSCMNQKFIKPPAISIVLNFFCRVITVKISCQIVSFEKKSWLQSIFILKIKFILNLFGRYLEFIWCNQVRKYVKNGRYIQVLPFYFELHFDRQIYFILYWERSVRQL